MNMLHTLAIVSGSTGGIGKVCTERLWEEGYSLIALGHTPSKCQGLRDWFLAHPREQQEGHVLSMDLRNDAQIWRIRALIDEFAYDVALLAVCHGAAPQPCQALYADVPTRMVFDVDVMGALALCQVAGRYMIEQRHGCIVLLSSLHSNQTFPERVPYVVSKSALCGIARALAVEWGQYGINVNALCPWQVAGERTDKFLKQAHEKCIDLLEAYKQRSPMRRLVQPEELANTVMWLAQTPSVTGQEIVIDTGVSASMFHEGYKEK